MNPDEGLPKPFASDPDRGRGKTLEESLNDAIRKKGAAHGDVFEVTLYVTVSNPKVGEYIVELRP